MIELTTTIGNYTVKVEGDTQIDVWDKMSEMAEILSVGAACGKTAATDTIPVTRKKDDYIFREWKCVSSGACLGLGQSKAGSLFPKRKDKDGEWLDNHGWLTWGERKQEMQSAGSGSEDWGGFK
jgi:hypothetical protein|tara:strand:+ start:101 stop:472 length:372 start_codon:yes stop_codon:yes gene_type:complete